MKFLLVLVVCVSVLLASQITAARILAITDLLRDYDVQQHLDQPRVQTAKEQYQLFIPTSLKGCTDYACQNICRMLGFNHGTCVSDTTCHCYN